MTHSVHLLPGGHEYEVEAHESILEAGLKAGLALAYGCSNAQCGLCKAKLVSGHIMPARQSDYVLTEADKATGRFLMCANGPSSDVVVEAPEASGSGDVPWQEIRARVTKLEQPTDQVTVLHLKTPRTQRLRFLAGQYVSLSLGEGEVTEDFFVASCPCDDMRLQFHVPRMPTSPFGEYVRNRLAKTHIVDIKGPGGNLYFREQRQRPILFVAVDTGFAPIRSLVEQAMALDIDQDMYLYWLATGKDGPYLDNLCRSWADVFDNIHYYPLRPTADVDPGHTLFAKLIENHSNFNDLDAYLSGPAEVVEAVKSSLLSRGAETGHLFAEALRHTSPGRPLDSK